MFEIIIFITFIIIGYTIGSSVESRHYKSIKKREHQFLNLPAVTIKKTYDSDDDIDHAALVEGAVVISIDYFKKFLANLRNLFGGEVMAYESLIDRARREAILRMKEKSTGADVIVNMRIETSSIGKNANRKKGLGCIEALAYGTAITFKKR